MCLLGPKPNDPLCHRSPSPLQGPRGDDEHCLVAALGRRAMRFTWRGCLAERMLSLPRRIETPDGAFVLNRSGMRRCVAGPCR